MLFVETNWAVNWYGFDEVLVQMIDVLDHPAVHRSTHREVVEDRQVLDHLAQPDATRVRADGHAELGRQQQDRHVVVDAADARGVELEDVDRLGLEQLLEQHRVLAVLPGGHPDRRHRGPHAAVPEDVVG